MSDTFTKLFKTHEQTLLNTFSKLSPFAEMFLRHNKELFEYYDKLLIEQKQKQKIPDKNNIYEGYTSHRSNFNPSKDESKKQFEFRKKDPLNENNIQDSNTLLSIIKDEITDIRKHLLGKYIKELQHEIHIEKIHTKDICFITELKDKRIATCSKDKSISIISINYETKKWTQDIKQENAHNDWIYSLCELSNNRLVSNSWDKTIKIWSITPTALNLLSTLTNHSERILKVIPLTNNRFGSCSDDKTVKIWNSENYSLITSLQHEGNVYDILKLKQHEILVTSNYDSSIDFWDLKNYVKLNSLKGFYANPRGQKMIELPNGFIAISSVSKSSGYPIIIIDPINYTIVKQIIDQEYIPSYSSLCVLDKHSFIYAYEGNIIQISIDNDYLIVYGAVKENQLDGWNGLISVNGGEYLLVVNNSNTGFKGIKPCYKD